MISTSKEYRRFIVNERLRLNRAREILQPTPVTLGVMPAWFRDRLLAACVDKECTDQGLLDRVFGRNNPIIERWGSTTLGSREVFVAEPLSLMVTGDGLAELTGAAKETISCGVWLDSNAYCSPGHAVRVVFEQAQRAMALGAATKLFEMDRASVISDELRNLLSDEQTGDNQN